MNGITPALARLKTAIKALLLAERDTTTTKGKSGIPLAAKVEVARLAQYLKYYFRMLEVDITKVDMEGIYNRNVLQPGAKMTAPQMQMAMIDAIRTVGPIVDGKSKLLYDSITKALVPAYVLGSKEVFRQLGTEPISGGGITAKVDTEKAGKGKIQQQATAWAGQHAGALVTNVDDTTKHGIAQIIAKGIDNQLGVPGTARLLKKAYPELIGTKRGKLIANTEIHRAYYKANYEQMVRLGIPYKTIVTNDPCPICVGNKAQGPIPTLTAFKGGTKGSDKRHPPFHPDCRCALVAALAPKGVDVPPMGEPEIKPVKPAIKKGGEETLKDILRIGRKESKIQAEREANLKAIDKFWTTPTEPGIVEKLQVLFDKEVEFANLLKKERDTVLKKAHKKIFLEEINPITLPGIRVSNNVSSLPVNPKNEAHIRKQIEDGVDFISKVAGGGLKDDGYFEDMRIIQGPRDKRASFCIGTNTMRIKPNEEQYVVVHELGHWIEDRFGKYESTGHTYVRFSTHAIRFLESRTAGEIPVKLADLQPTHCYRPNERAKKDKFIDPYVGKQYLNVDATKILATEVVSMGIQFLYQDPLKFAREDPEHFKFIIDLLRGLL